MTTYRTQPPWEFLLTASAILCTVTNSLASHTPPISARKSIRCLISGSTRTPTPWSLVFSSSCASAICASPTSRPRRIKPLPNRYRPMATLCPIIFWRIDSFAQTFRTAATDLSLALRAEQHAVFLFLSRVPSPPHGRKGVLPAVLSMLPTSLFISGLAPASQPCGPTPLSSKPASAFLTTHLANFCLGTTVFLRGLCFPPPSSAHLRALCVVILLCLSSRPKSRPVCGSERAFCVPRASPGWRDRGNATATHTPLNQPQFARSLPLYFSLPQKIGIGGAVARSPLPHHRTGGSAYGGSVS